MPKQTLTKQLQAKVLQAVHRRARQHYQAAHHQRDQEQAQDVLRRINDCPEQ